MWTGRLDVDARSFSGGSVRGGRSTSGPREAVRERSSFTTCMDHSVGEIWWR
jgi:hypothetical protein